MQHEPIGGAGAQQDRHPMHFVHVISRFDKRILLLQKYSLLRLHFEVDPIEIFNVGQGKHLPHHLEDQGGLIEGKLFRHAFLGEAIRPEVLNIQNRKRLANR